MVVNLIILIISIVLYLFAPSHMDKSFMVVCLCLAAISFISVFKGSKSKDYDLNSCYLRHSIVFLLCYAIVFYQCDLDYILGLCDSDAFFVFDTRVVCKSLSLSVMGQSGLVLGYLFYKRKEKLLKNEYRYEINIQSTKIVNFIVVFMLTAYLILVPKDYLSNGYGSGMDNGAVYGIIGYLAAVFLTLFVFYSYNYISIGSNKGFQWLKAFKSPVILSIIYMLIVVMTGRRTESVRVALMLLFSYVFVKGNNANYKKIGVIGVLVALFFAIVGVTRNEAGTSMSEGFNTLKQNASILPFTQELAYSVRTLHIGMSYIPDPVPYNWGLTFFPGFFNIIPGSYSLIQFIFGIKFLGSDGLITNLFFEGSEHIYGLGSSIVTDVYVSFGPIGVMFIFALFGALLRYIEIGTFCVNKSPYFLALSMSIYSQFMFACRGSFSTLLLGWAYACVFIFLLLRPQKRQISLTK